MSARYIVITSLLAGAVAAGPGARPALGAPLEDKDIKLSGCLVRGDGDGAGYLLSNMPAEPVLQRSANSNIAPSAIGTSGNYTTIFYWLDGDDALKTHIGNRVEIEGKLESGPREGQITIDRKDKWTEMTVKAGGRTMKANLPHTSLLPAPGKDGDSKNDIYVRRVDVSKVRMLAASCEP